MLGPRLNIYQRIPSQSPRRDCLGCGLRRERFEVSAAVLILEAGVGLWGFVLHTLGNLRGPSVHTFDNFIYGAPPMAPLLFPNLAVLGLIGLWQLRNKECAEPLVTVTQGS